MDDGRRYRLREELGRGGMGIVWRAHDERLGREVAVKILHDWVAADGEGRRRFEREAAALARLQHPHVVRLYDVVEHRGRTLLVMELVEGSSLADLIAGRTLDWDEARRLAVPITEALAYAHARGVVHRDLTPANVLVERESGRVVVSDFGLARLTQGDGSVSVSDDLAGTPEYWSPEQAAGRETGPPADLYALGCLLHRLLTGATPFSGDDRLAVGLRRIHEDAPRLEATTAGAPADACRLIDRLLARDPAARPTAAAAARRLGTSPEPSAETRAPRPAREPATLAAATIALPAARRRGRRKRVRVGLLGAAGLVALSGGAVYAVAGQESAGISAPAVVGDGLAQARQEVAAAAVDAGVERPLVQVTGRAYSEDVPEGAVLAQDPGPGDHLPSTSELRVRISLGSSWATVPVAEGMPTAQALRALGEAGFTPVRRYAPSLGIAPWHVTETRPAAGSRLRRPAEVEVVVSTGPPRAVVPDVRGEDATDAVAELERAGFAASVREAASSAESPGTVLELRPGAGTKRRVGSTVTVVVAREPRWEVVRAFEGEESASADALAVPAGARVVLEAHNTSFLGILEGWVAVSWDGDAAGSAELDGGDERVLVEPSDAERTLALRVEPHGSARWELRVEAVR